ncbi:MAG: hypothetical protein R3C20_11395 [Planctomycetaceae bacterium]
MIEPFSIDYELRGSGWALGTVSHASQRVPFVASYLNDPLSELAFSAHHLFQGGDTAAVVFMNEPGEHHLVFTRISDLECRFTLTWFNENVSYGCNFLPGSVLLMAGTLLIRSLVDQVHALLTRLLDLHGTDGYKKPLAQSWFPHSRVFFAAQEPNCSIAIAA